MRCILAVLVSLMLAIPAFAQETSAEGAGAAAGAGEPDTLAPLRDAGEAAPNAALERILARQRGEVVDVPVTRETIEGDDAVSFSGDLPAGLTDEGAFAAVRAGTNDAVASTSAPAATVLIQTGGMAWEEMRNSDLKLYGGGLLLVVLALTILFFLWRGRIRIEGGRSGRTITRFGAVERFTHWLLAGSFILLAISGLIVLFGRIGLIPLIGHEAYAALAVPSKWVHNNVSWAFMLALVLAFLFWIWHNIPNRTDWVWLKQGGGLFDKSKHPPAKKFNAGQKVVFWVTILFGASVSASGLALLFPFELPMFAKTFAAMNWTGLPELITGAPIDTDLAPQEEQALATLWHAIVSFLMMAMVIGHIYLGSVGMQGAFDAMGSGEVDYNWAKEHHRLWVEEKEAKEARSGHRGEPQGGAVAPAE